MSLKREISFKSYLINLDGSDARLASASKQFDEQKIEFERISAVNGHRLNISELTEYDAQATERYMGRRMTGGEIGCLYSHLKALKVFLESDAPYAVVFEDDFLILDGLIDTTLSTIDWLDNHHPDWEVVNLSAPARKYSVFRASLGRSEIRQAYYFPMLATALLWSRSGAEAFLAYHDKIIAPYDNILREWQSKRGCGFTILPQIVSTTGANSDIDGGKKPRNRDRKSSILYGIRKQRRTIMLKWRALRLMRKQTN